MNITLLASTIAATVTEYFNFEVVKRALFAREDDCTVFDPEIYETDHFGLFRTDTNECVGNTCKKGYIPHLSADVAAATEAGAKAFDGEVSLLCHFKNAHHVHIVPTQEERTAIYGTEDNIFPVMGIRGGFDGRGFVFYLGFKRDLCSNLAEMKTVGCTRISIHHNNNLRDHMDELIQVAKDLKLKWSEIVEIVREMESNQFDIDFFINQLYPKPDLDATPRTVTNYNKTVGAIKQRLKDEYIQTSRLLSSDGGSAWFDTQTGEIYGQCSGWLLYNAVQGYVQHDGRGAGTRTEFQGMIRASNSAIVTKAEKLALRLPV